ncbi:MAG: sugar transferase [bacterium]|nr:sugar transferase [bacterium]MDD5354471.1 sugar transferase [bacterium]MDD5755694.1 sugar transferase [bacterium]
MQNKRISIYLKILALLIDGIIIYLSFYLAYWLRFYSGYMIPDKGIPSLSLYTQAFGLITLISLLVFKITGLYILKDRFSLDEFPDILKAVTVSAIIVMAVTFLYRQFTFSRIVLMMGWLINIIFMAVWRSGFSQLRRYLKYKLGGIKKVLIVGAGRLAKEIYQIVQADQHVEYKILGLINYPKIERKDWDEFKNIPVFEGIENLGEIIQKLQINEIIMTKLPEASGQMLDLITQAEKAGVEFKIIPDVLGLITTRSNLDNIFGLPVLTLKKIQLRGVNALFKRCLDIIIAIIILSIIALPMIIIAIIIKLDSPGPVFYRHSRMGYKGNKFMFLKFRSMVADADDRLKDVINMNERKGPVFKMKADPRITKFGKFIRHYSLDELPQFINVLIGNMSIVGPRPQVLWEASHYDEWAKRRLMVLPGITGLWQISGRSNLSYEEMIKLDIYYIENWSVWLDIEIILQTIPTVLFARGAY